MVNLEFVIYLNLYILGEWVETREPGDIQTSHMQQDQGPTSKTIVCLLWMKNTNHCFYLLGLIDFDDVWIKRENCLVIVRQHKGLKEH